MQDKNSLDSGYPGTWYVAPLFYSHISYRPSCWSRSGIFQGRTHCGHPSFSSSLRHPVTPSLRLWVAGGYRPTSSS